MQVSRRFWFSMVAIGLIAPLGLALSWRPAPPPVAPPYSHLGQSELAGLPLGLVERVLDGDTLRLHLPEVLLTLEVDLQGLKAPGSLQAFGQEATFFTRSLLEGEQVRIVWAEQDQAAQGSRRHALIYREPDGLFVNLELVRAGLAEPRPTGDEALDDLFAAYAARAEALIRNATGGGEPLAGSGGASTEPNPGSDLDAGTDDSDSEPAAEPDQAGLILFITPSGTRYHLETCRFVSETSTRATPERIRGRYQPCRVCKPPSVE